MIRHMSKKLDLVSIYLDNYFEKVNGRTISKKMNVSPQTGLNHVNELVKLNILKYDLEGRNKSYYLNFEDPLTFQLVKLAEEFTALNLMQNSEIKSLIKDFDGLYESLIIFGSFANNKQKKDSDLDLVFVGSSNTLKLKQIFKLKSREINAEFITLSDFKKSFKDKNSLSIEIMKNHILFGNVDLLIQIFIGKK